MPRVIYVCSPCIFSLYFANCLVRLQGLKPAAIVLTSAPARIDGRKIDGLGGLAFLFRRVGWRYALYLLVSAVGLPALALLNRNPKARLLSFSELSRTFEIELVHVESLNTKGFRARLAAFGPCIVASMFLAQILSVRTLRTPEATFLNLHPSQLPNFRGADPITHFLRTDHQEFGVTLHRMTPGIDEGRIVAYRSVPWKGSDSVLGLMTKSALVGAQLLAATLPNSQGELPEGQPQESRDVQHGYSSYPTADEVAELRARGRSIAGYSDALRSLRLPLGPMGEGFETREA